MNYNIDTPEGMENAVAWTRALMLVSRPVFTWAVPMYGGTYIIDQTNKTYTTRLSRNNIDKVLATMKFERVEL